MKAPLLLLKNRDWVLFQPWGQRIHVMHGHRHIADAPGRELRLDDALARVAQLRQDGYKSAKTLPREWHQ